MPVPPKVDPVKTCEACGSRFERRRFNGRLEDRTRFLSRRFCSQSCGNTKVDVVEDTLHWRARKHLGAQCEECGTTEHLHAHHKDSDPSNNNPANIATLCASCHLRWHWKYTRRAG